MKKICKLFVISFLLLAVPFSIVIGCTSSIRFALGKPFYYDDTNKKSLALEMSLAQYAKVQKDCYLFRSSDITDKSYQNVYFVVPETYFVKIIDKTMTVYKVQYQDEVGFVAPESVKIVDFVPTSPELAGVTFDLKSNVSTQIRETPSISSSNIKTIIPEGERGLSYIASTIGERPMNGVSNIWFFAYYFPKNDPTRVYKGYVYEGATENLSAIDFNVEDNVVDEPIDEVSTDIDYSVNPTIKVILIVLICLPILLVFILLLVGNRKSKNTEYKELLDDEVKNEKPQKEKAPKRQTPKKFVSDHLKKIDDFEGQTLERKPTYYTNFLEKTTTNSVASLKPEFPTYEVIDDDDLL